MTQPSGRLFAAASGSFAGIPRAFARQTTRQIARPFSQTCLRRNADSVRPPGPGSPSTSSSSSGMSELQAILSATTSGNNLASDTMARALNRPSSASTSQSEDSILGANLSGWNPEWGPVSEPFHFHVYSHKHNTHVTVTKPNRDAIVSMSAGNLGFKKSKRGTYDAAYQLVAHVMDKLHQGNWHRNIHQLEIVLRSFGQGREAAIKILLGSEGRLFREKIVRISDDTRIKFGGTRSQNPRRLG
ncbi:small subunit ribosomal protein S11 [Microdochium nivale]|nr:small subunit ribosomal protein S11 [Microdochium nivale]